MSENSVTELPDNFRGWMRDNEQRIARAKSLHYFIRDNEHMIAEGGQTQPAPPDAPPSTNADDERRMER